MEENYIIVRGLQQNDIVYILINFANEYRDIEAVKNIQLYVKSNEAQSFLILFSEQPDFDIFSFLVNYINYPSKIKVSKPFIRGYFKTRSILSGHDKIRGNRVMVYISDNDTEHDNVFFTDETGAHFINDFGRGIKKSNYPDAPFELIPYTLSDYSHVTDVSPIPKGYKAPNARKKPWWKFW
ncbi:MAG: hypothetical protein V4581_09245 [Bacteroidota bacterium]